MLAQPSIGKHTTLSFKTMVMLVDSFYLLSLTLGNLKVPGGGIVSVFLLWLLDWTALNQPKATFRVCWRVKALHSEKVLSAEERRLITIPG